MSGQEQQENDPLIGTTFADRYQLVSRLGKGGMAVVYKATDKNLGREVALKVLRKDIAADPVAAKRLVREARAAAALHHPHIITIHDVGEYAGTVYVVMEILVGKPLSDVMEEAGALGVERSLNIAEQLVSALSVAHAQNIIHRDIKPENLYLLSAGGGDFVKVLDFSIAKLPTEMVTAALTRAGSVFGTPHYMAPEQVEGKEVGPQTDLYAVGAVIYEMIAGEPPYDGASVIDILLKHVKSPAPQLSKLGIKLPHGLSELCVKLLAKKKQDRPQTADAVREELARMLADVRHDNESVSGAVTESELSHEVAAALHGAGAASSRPDNPTVREDQEPQAGVSAPGGRPATAAHAPAEPEANTVAVDTAAVTAGVVAARAKAMSSGMSPVAAMTVDIDEPITAIETLPDDLPGGPPPDDLPNTPTAAKRKFVAIGDDSSDQRTIVGVGLGKMVAEIARQRATGATAVPPLQAGASAAAAATAQQPGLAVPAPATATRQPVPPASSVGAPAPSVAPPQGAAPPRPTSAGIEAPGAVTAGTNRPNAPKPPPPPAGHAHTMARRPPPSRAHAVPTVDDRATTQPGLGLDPVPPPPSGEGVAGASTQVVRIAKASGAHPVAPADKPFLPKPVIIFGLVFAVLAVGAALWLLLGSGN